MNSKRKGKAGELEWCKFCRERGFESVRRTAQFCGNTGEASDCVGLPGVHQEIKRVEKLNIHEAMEQAVRDSGEAGRGEIPIVAHRRNKTEWLVTMRAEDWLKMYKCVKENNFND